MCTAWPPRKGQTLGRHAALARPHGACQQASNESWTCQSMLQSGAKGAGRPNDRNCLMSWSAQLLAEGLAKASYTFFIGCHGATTLLACRRPAQQNAPAEATTSARMLKGHQQASGHRYCASSWAPCSFLASAFTFLVTETPKPSIDTKRQGQPMQRKASAAWHGSRTAQPVKIKLGAWP